VDVIPRSRMHMSMSYQQNQIRYTHIYMYTDNIHTDITSSSRRISALTVCTAYIELLSLRFEPTIHLRIYGCRSISSVERQKGLTVSINGAQMACYFLAMDIMYVYVPCSHNTGGSEHKSDRNIIKS
jgi:hypothetical protein